jgi:acyl-homoserine lactone acylase PvdQ
MDTLQFFPQNVMVADTSGNIYYQRTGRVPRRPEGYDWTRPVDGSTSATAWQGFHPASDHVQILNPPQGYMQNCNIPPDGMMVDSPLTPDKYPSYLYNTEGGYLNPRGARAVELLSQDDSVTIAEALAIAVDVHPFGVERWVGVLRDADAKSGDALAGNADYVAGIKDVLDWDMEVRRDSTAALKYYYWREQLKADHGRDTMAEAESAIDGKRLRALGKAEPMPELTDEQRTSALSSFVNALAKLKADFGSLDATYGDKFRVGRDDVSWPVGGGDDELTTLRCMSWEQERDDHTRWGRGGQTSTQLVVLSKPIQSWMYLPVGESDRPESPHYRDQAEMVFGPRRLKETWWLPENLAGHTESRTVLPNAG